MIDYNNAAFREKRNRVLKKEFLRNLQDDAIYPVVFEMYHEKNEMRVQISFFEDGNGMLDMTRERYDMLPIAKWNEKMQQLEIENEEEIYKRFPYKNREWTEKVEKRLYRRQGKFRKEVLSAYDATCAVCGLNEPSVLRAAHIVPVAKGGDG